MKHALIFGVTGQDGSFLAELLLSKGYAVTGVARRTSTPSYGRLTGVLSNPNFKLIAGDVTDAASVHRVVLDVFKGWIRNVDKDTPSPWVEIYNLAAQSHVGMSFDHPSQTTDVTYGGTLNILEVIRNFGLKEMVRFYQASSSEMFGSCCTTKSIDGILKWETPQEGGFQNELTPFAPNSPYAIAKLASHHLCRVYREAYGLFACSGILFNHESERRGIEFVTQKIAKHVATWKRSHDTGLVTGTPLKLGNLDAQRDWGYAPDYVRGMHAMLQQKFPGDYVLATGETHSVRQFVIAAFKAVGVDVGDEIDNWVVIDDSCKRPLEVPMLRGDASKAKRILGWSPTVSFDQLVARMVAAA